MMFKRFIKEVRREFDGYNGKTLTKDLMAGLTVAAVALPLALAFGVSSGATAASGLVTAIVAGLVISALSGGFYQISGPTGAMAAILISVIATYGMQGMFVATFMAGVLLVLAAVFHLGNLTSFVPSPVITGFTSGIAVIIALGQVDNLLGTTSAGGSVVEKLSSYSELGFSPDPATTAIGLAVIFFMILFPKKWNALVPASLISIILATGTAIFWGLDIAQVGEIPKTLLFEDRLFLTQLNISSILPLLAPAFSIALLNMLESLLCGASAGRSVGSRMNNDQELLAQGVGNMLLPFFGGIPATAALARTSVAIRSGAKTRLTGIFHAIGLLLMMFLLAPVISRVPIAALAGVLMVTAWRMNEWTDIKYIFSRKFTHAAIKFFATMAATIVFNLTVAILVGVGLGLIFLIVRLSRLQINYEPVDMSRIKCSDDTLVQRYSRAVVAYITGPILFANINIFEQIQEKSPDYNTILLSMRGVPEIDISAAQVMLEMFEKLQARGVDIVLCGVSDSAMEMIRNSGIYDLLGQQAFYWSVERALTDPRPMPL
jgi:sulfate permease, SulP family